MYYRTRARDMILTAAVLSAVSAPVYAAKEAVEDLPHYNIGDVVVTASRTEQAVKDSPSAVEIITREDIENLGADSLEQALALTVGLTTEVNRVEGSHSVGSQIGIRGGSSQQTLILIDGRRVRSENTTELANVYELQRVNMDDVERIEIVRGVGSSLYGSEAMGGVINIITKRPEKLHTKISTDWSSNVASIGLLQDFGKLNGGWELKLNARANDIRRHTDTGGTNMFGDKYFFNIDARKKLAANKNIDIFFDYIKEDIEQIVGVKQTYYDNYRTGAGLSFNGKDKRGDYELRGYYTNFRRSQTGDNDDKAEFDSTIIDGKRSFNLGNAHRLTVGGEFRAEDYKGTRVLNPDILYHSALYVQDEWMPNDRLLIIPSVRYDYNNTFGSEVTAKIGSTYHLSDNTRVKVNFGSAYRAPTASELYMNWIYNPIPTMTVYVYGNRSLKPEKAINFDISFEAERGRTSGKATYFHNDIKDMIYLERIVRPLPPFPPSRYVGIGNYINTEAAIQGVEIEAKQRLGDKFTLRLTHTYLDAVDGDGVRLPNRARNNTSLQLTYNDKKRNGISATLWNDWIGDYAYEEAVRGTTYKRKTHGRFLNFVINKQFNDTFSAYFGVNNILGEDNTVLNYDGRVWRGGVKMTF